MNIKLFYVKIIIILFLPLLFFYKSLIIKETITIPDINNILNIEIYNDYNNNYTHSIIKDYKDILPIHNIILSSKKKQIKSVNDTPNNINGKLIKIIFNTNTNTSLTLFLYKNYKNKYYIEKPYEGIYEISKKEYRTFMEYVKFNSFS